MSEEIVDPSEVAEPTAGIGPDAEEGELPPGAEPEPEPGGGRPWWMEGLRSTEPNPPLESVGSLGDIRRYWQQYGMRGLQKLGSVDDAEAWVDLTKFAVGAILTVTQRGGDGDGQEGDGGGEVPDGVPVVGDG